MRLAERRYGEMLSEHAAGINLGDATYLLISSFCRAVFVAHAPTSLLLLPRDALSELLEVATVQSAREHEQANPPGRYLRYIRLVVSYVTYGSTNRRAPGRAGQTRHACYMRHICYPCHTSDLAHTLLVAAGQLLAVTYVSSLLAPGHLLAARGTRAAGLLGNAHLPTP